MPGVQISEMFAARNAEGRRATGSRQRRPAKVQKVRGSLYAGQERHARGYFASYLCNLSRVFGVDFYKYKY